MNYEYDNEYYTSHEYDDIKYKNVKIYDNYKCNYYPYHYINLKIVRMNNYNKKLDKLPPALNALYINCEKYNIQLNNLPCLLKFIRISALFTKLLNMYVCYPNLHLTIELFQEYIYFKPLIELIKLFQLNNIILKLYQFPKYTRTLGIASDLIKNPSKLPNSIEALYLYELSNSKELRKQKYKNYIPGLELQNNIKTYTNYENFNLEKLYKLDQLELAYPYYGKLPLSLKKFSITKCCDYYGDLSKYFGFPKYHNIEEITICECFRSADQYFSHVFENIDPDIIDLYGTEEPYTFLRHNKYGCTCRCHEYGEFNMDGRICRCQEHAEYGHNSDEEQEYIERDNYNRIEEEEYYDYLSD